MTTEGKTKHRMSCQTAVELSSLKTWSISFITRILLLLLISYSNYTHGIHFLRYCNLDFSAG